MQEAERTEKERVRANESVACCLVTAGLLESLSTQSGRDGGREGRRKRQKLILLLRWQNIFSNNVRENEEQRDREFKKTNKHILGFKTPKRMTKKNRKRELIEKKLVNHNR